MTSAKISRQSFNSGLLQKLFSEKLLTDIDLVVEGETYSGHRAILSGCSEYFFNMFTGTMVETSLSSVPISGVSSGIFKILFGFIYGESEAAIVEKLRFEVCSVEDLLHAADMFQVESLKNIVIAHLINNLDEENMLAVYMLGWKYNIQKVCEKASLKISMKFPKLLKMEEFKYMKIDQLKALFYSPYLQSAETNNCKAILKWFNFDTKNREKDFDQIMSLFCYHTIEDRLFRFHTVDKIYEKRNRKRSYEEACGDNPRCPINCPETVKTVEELADLYGDRCIHLSKNTDLMNTFTCSYSLYEGNIPNSMKKFQLCEQRRKKNEGLYEENIPYILKMFQMSEKRRKKNEYDNDNGFVKISFEKQIQHGDHHVEKFYQGTTHDSDHLIIITANYVVRCGWQGDNSLGIFSRLPRIRLIIDDSQFNKEQPLIPNPRYFHQADNEHPMYRYPLMLVIGGCEVDMDDAVRFACSLVCRFSSNCPTCSGNDMNLSNILCKYINIWSPSLKKNRADHFGYE